MNNYLFVTTMSSIYYLVYPLIKKLEGEVYIVTQSNQVEKFFREFTDCKIIKTNVSQNFYNTKSIKETLLNIFRIRLEYKRLFKHIKESNIYFFGKSWRLTVFYYIQRLSKNNSVNFIDLKLNNVMKTKKGLRSSLMVFMTKLLLNIDIKLVERGDAESFTLDSKFLTKNKISVEKHEKIKNENRINLDVMNDKDVIYVLSGLVGCNHVEEQDYVETTNIICSILEKYFPGRYMIKPHYNEEKIYETVDDDVLLPSYIPLEFLLDYPLKFVVGVASLGLTTTNSISLLHLFKYKDEKVKQYYKDWLDVESSNMVFPKTFGELEETIRSMI